LALNNTIKN